MKNNIRNCSLGLLFILIALTGQVFADGTPAGETIVNQASATYQDADGNVLTETSDPVTTIVTQVYSFTIEPDDGNAPTGTDPDADNNYALDADAANTVTQLAGGQVVFEYTVTNSGNGDDTIALTADQAATGEDSSADSFDLSGVTVYVDDNGTPGLQTGAGGDSVVASGGTIDLAADASATVYVVGTVPGGTAANSVALLDLTGTGSDPAPAAGPPQSNIDNNNIAQVTVVDDASLTLSKDATFSGGTITYTVGGSNVGAQPADPVVDEITVTGIGTDVDAIVIRDALPTATSSGAALSFGSVTSFAPVTATVAYSDDNGTTWSTTEPATVTDIALVIESSIGVGTSYEIVYTMTTDGDEVAGDTVDNDAEIAYEDSTNTRQTQGATDTLTIPSDPDVLIGPNDDANANGLADSDGDDLTDANGAAAGDGGVNYTSTSGDTIYYGDGTASYDADEQYVVRVAQGDTVHFTNTVNNPGNETTRYRLTLDGTSTLPAGFGVTFYRASDTSIAITEIVLDPDESEDIVVAITVPSGATAGTFNYTAIVNATRVVGGAGGTLDTGVQDSTTNIIGAIFAPAAVDLQNEDGGTPTDATQTYDVEIDPSDATPTTQDIPLTITNGGTDNDSYTLTEVLTDLPAGTTVTYYIDEDNDGTFSAGDTLIPGPTPSVAVNGGASEDLVAVVTFPVGSGSANGSIDFTATSTNDPTQSDTVTDIINVNVPALNLINDESTTVRSPDQVIFEHTLTNSGDVVFDTLDIVPTPPASPEYTYTIYVDENGDGLVDAGDTQVYNGTTGTTYTDDLAVGATLDILVVVDVPAGLSAGYSEVTDITVTGTTAAGSEATSEVTDTVTVSPANLDVEKTARTCADAACTNVLSATGATAEPDDYIEYTITAENVGTVDTFKTEVKDTIPDFVTVTSVSVSTTLSGARTATIYYGTDSGSGCSGYTTTVPTSATLASGDTLCVALDTDADTNIDTDDDLLPGESFVITLVVQIE